MAEALATRVAPDLHIDLRGTMTSYQNASETWDLAVVDGTLDTADGRVDVPRVRVVGNAAHEPRRTRARGGGWDTLGDVDDDDY